MALEWGCSQAEASTRIRNSQPHVEKRRMQQAEFADADKKAAEAVPGASKGQRRLIAKEIMIGAIAPHCPICVAKGKGAPSAGRNLGSAHGPHQQNEGVQQHGGSVGHDA